MYCVRTCINDLMPFTGKDMEGRSAPQLPIGTNFSVGDKVRVDLDVDVLKVMQEGHGGWNTRMANVCVVFCEYLLDNQLC